MNFADLYDVLMADVDYKQIFAWLIPFLKPNDTILDAGCGSGYFLEVCLRAGHFCWGIDKDERMLALAQQRLQSKNLSALLFHHNLKKPFLSDADVVVSFFDVLNYSKNYRPIVKNIKQNLNPEGRFIFDVYKEDVLQTHDGYYEEETEPLAYTWHIKRSRRTLIHTITHGDDTYLIKQTIYPKEHYLKTLKQVGFKDVQILEGPDPRKHYFIAE
ncbi:MAG: class I SAM-dependent methyltransferase [Acholeplasmataceae bacterium]|nr:class I SAM-dependent methyltransferase [Acholeplasmataceae bacterium]